MMTRFTYSTQEIQAPWLASAGIIRSRGGEVLSQRLSRIRTIACRFGHLRIRRAGSPGWRSIHGEPTLACCSDSWSIRP